MKIVFDARILHITLKGVFEQLTHLVQYLVNNGVQCYVVAPKKIKKIPGFEKVEVIELDIPRKVSFREIYIENFVIPKLINKVKPDIFHSTLNWGIPKLSCPSILTIHDIIPFKILENQSPRQFNIYNKLMKSSVKRAKEIITISQFSKKDILDNLKIEPNKIHVIYNGFKPSKKPTNFREKTIQAHKKYGISKKFLLAVGGFFERKNTPRIIEAFVLLRKKSNYNYQLVIPGKYQGNKYLDDQFDICRDIVKRNSLEKEVIFCGFLGREDFEILLFNTEVVLYPTLYEGFGLPVLEAMSAGVPVITSNVTSLPEIADNAACLVNPYNTTDISQAIEKILYDKKFASDLIKKGKKRILDFSWEKMGQETLNLYYKLLEK